MIGNFVEMQPQKQKQIQATQGRRETTSGPGTKNFTGPCQNVEIAGSGVFSIFENATETFVKFYNACKVVYHRRGLGAEPPAVGGQ